MVIQHTGKKEDAALALSSVHTGLTAANNRTIPVLPANSILFNFFLGLFFYLRA